jgi:hypothetical protein
MPHISNPRMVYPKSAVMFHRDAIILVGGVLICAADADQDFGHMCLQGPPADGDTFEQSFLLAGGNYTLAVHGATDTVMGILDWYIDGVLVVAGQDYYSALTVYNAVQTAAVTVIGDGQHTLTGVVNGQNPASADYAIVLTCISLY